MEWVAIGGGIGSKTGGRAYMAMADNGKGNGKDNGKGKGMDNGNGRGWMDNGKGKGKDNGNGTGMDNGNGTGMDNGKGKDNRFHKPHQDAGISRPAKGHCK